MERFIGKGWLTSLGYRDIDTSPMASQIEKWWGWYTATCTFYESLETDGNHVFKVSRNSIMPAKMVCEDWASLLFNERAEIGVGGEEDGLDAADTWLREWIDTGHFMQLANRTTERAMALGTAGWALRLKGVDEATGRAEAIVCERYDARHIVPLAYDGDTCTEALFRSKALVESKTLNQLRLYRPEGGTYVIHTAFFTDAGRQVFSDDVVEVFDTGSPACPFALLRPGIDNTRLEFHPFGVSVFDEALGAVRLTDLAVDNTDKDIYYGQKMTFLPESMLKEDSHGKIILPRAANQQSFVAYEDDTGIAEDKGKPYEYNPDMRIADNRLAIKTALELLGERCGLGKDYYSLDERGGVGRAKTATEVASDQTKLINTIHKHEEAITPAIEAICEAACALANTCLGLSLPDITGKVTIVYGDSIIEDDAAVRQRDREDVAAGLLAPWDYIARWRAMPVDEARKAWDEIQAAAQGSSEPVEELL